MKPKPQTQADVTTPKTAKTFAHAMTALALLGLTACSGGSGGSSSQSATETQADATEQETENQPNNTGGDQARGEVKSLAAPMGLKASEQNSVITLEWAPVAGATSYSVFYRSDDSAEQLETVTTPMYEHLSYSGIQQWHYQVIAHGNDGNTSSEPSVGYALKMAVQDEASDVGL